MTNSERPALQHVSDAAALDAVCATLNSTADGAEALAEVAQLRPRLLPEPHDGRRHPATLPTVTVHVTATESSSSELSNTHLKRCQRYEDQVVAERLVLVRQKYAPAGEKRFLRDFVCPFRPIRGVAPGVR